jgi:hypothetical protein
MSIMRISALCLSALLALSACASSGSSDREWSPRTSREVRVYTGLPRCPVREVGAVRGRNTRELRQAAMQLRAHAVLMDRRLPSVNAMEPYTGIAVVFTQEDCRH